ncbi:peptidase [Arsenicicoccus dermatophilus]|uniref:peptidase n=1 Tax=Arsenicicoccus dermatophilus TaxID=1076331 RepID=UPI003917526A
MTRPARVPLPAGEVAFEITDAAWEMIAVLGGHLHAYVGGEGCRARSLAFTTDEPRGAVECELPQESVWDTVDWEDREWTEEALAALAARPESTRVTVSAELAPLLAGAVLDFGDYLAMERFVWSRLPSAVKDDRRCTCLRSFGAPRGRRATCLDDARQGLTRPG